MAGNLVTSVIMNLVDRVSGPTRRIANALAGLARRAGLGGLSTSARALQVALGNTLRHAVALGKGLAIAGGAAAGAVWAITRMIGGVATLGNEIKISSERLGVGAGWLQEWQYAAQQFGVGNDALIDGFKELSLRADEFVMTGSGGAAEAFKRLGITVKDLRGTAGDTEAMLNLVQSRLGGIQNDAAKQRIFDELFGGSGGEQMVTLLTQSREELDKLRQAARDNGAILSDEDIEQSRAYVRNMNDLSNSLQGIKNAVMTTLMPTMNQWLSSLRDLFKANRAVVTQQLLGGLKQLWTGLRAVGSAVAGVAGLVGGFGNLLGIVAGLLAANFLISVLLSTAALVKLGWAISVLAVKSFPAMIAGIKAFSLALLASPITWIILGITALAGTAYLIYQNWDGISAWFGNMWGQIRAFFDRGIGDIAKDLLSFSPAALLVKGIDAVFELFGARPLSQVARKWGAGLADGLRGVWAGVTAFFDRGIGDITRNLLAFSPAALLVQSLAGVFRLFDARALIETGRAWIGGLGRGIGQAWSNVTASFSGLWQRVVSATDQGLGAVASVVMEFNPAAVLVKGVTAVIKLFDAQALSQAGSEWVGGLWAGIRQRFEQMTGWLKQQVSSLTGWMPDWMKGETSLGRLGVPAERAPSLPALGAPVTAGRTAPMATAVRADVGGELRIRIDSEGRARVASMKRNGGLDYSVESGMLGVVP